MGILTNKNKKMNNTYLAISILGKSYRLNISYINSFKVNIIRKDNEILLSLPSEYKHKDNIDIINKSVRSLYDQIATVEIENAMELARHLLGFAPSDYLIKRLNGTLCKSSKNIIVVSPDIVQYNREVINMTVLQAFCKSKYRTNSNDYKETVQLAINAYENHFARVSKVS